jgi:hypothetical protein
MAIPIDGGAKTRRKIQIFALSDDVQRLLEVSLFRGPEAVAWPSQCTVLYVFVLCIRDVGLPVLRVCVEDCEVENY